MISENVKLQLKSENNGNSLKINDESSWRKKRSRPQEEDDDEEPLDFGVYRKSSILPLLLSHTYVNQDKVDGEENSAKSKFFRFGHSFLMVTVLNINSLKKTSSLTEGP
jgi:hypothetical protein